MTEDEAKALVEKAADDLFKVFPSGEITIIVNAGVDGPFFRTHRINPEYQRQSDAMLDEGIAAMNAESEK
jgi:hypothetical protein